ncbi:hypothetical protein KUTeg_003829 [Tegillarca granosa]|uniref:Transposable element P transposase-like RNase H domain-containing protein n=1 Tax=Tegillarca granosa TaxID=220873 RepID=A0ABQ9FN81_TEGGR|nr:hypothetical protein KUTeg_003829 [Tegillarca granosa]
MPLTMVIDGHQQYCSIVFNSSKVTFHLRNVTFTLGFSLNVTQKNVDGLIHLITVIKICKGLDTTENESQALIVEYLSELSNENSGKKTTRSKSCKVIVNWTSKKECCDRCMDSIKQNRKRKRPPVSETESISEKKSEINPLQEHNLSSHQNVDNGLIEKVYSDQVSNSDYPVQVSQVDEESKIKLCKEDHEDMESILNKIVENGAPEQFKLLLESQLRNFKKGLEIHQRRWDQEVISVCLGLYIRSPRAYEDLKKSGLLVLPSQRLLQYYKNSIKQTTCFNLQNLIWMQKEALKQKVSDFGKHGGLVIDEMSIQDDLVIQKQRDSWNLVGIVDMDQTNNNIDILCNGRKKVQLATHALQFVFHGLTGFRWPVAYFGSNTATAFQLYNTFWKCVDVLDENGFTVDYVMLDGASTNRAFTNILFNNGCQREKKFKFQDIYDGNHSICAIQDIMHVLKRIETMIENQSQAGRYLVLNDCCIVWDHWVECFNFNFQNGFGIHKKLTDDHFTLTPASKMRNKLAIDVLLFLMKSYQATLHDPARLASSVELLENTSILTDLFCNSNQPICSKNDKRIELLREILHFFNDWESQIVNSVLYLQAKNLITQETRDDINSAVSGFISLCDTMLGKGNSINPGFLNSDIVENLFGQQRGIRNGLNANPTLAQYGPSNTAIILGQCSVSNKGNSGKSASFFTASTPGALNTTRNKSNLKSRRSIRI